MKESVWLFGVHNQAVQWTTNFCLYPSAFNVGARENVLLLLVATVYPVCFTVPTAEHCRQIQAGFRLETK